METNDRLSNLERAQQLLGDTLRQHAEMFARMDRQHEEHLARMERMDRQYEQLLEVQLDLARSHDEHEAKMDMMRATLNAIRDLLEEQRRN